MANLVFKFNWDHRPYPYNAAQGKRQFMLPFASGILNLTPSWDQVQGAGNASTGTLTSSKTDNTTGRVLRVGDFGLGSFSVSLNPDTILSNGFFHSNASSMQYCAFINVMHPANDAYGWQIGLPMGATSLGALVGRIKNVGAWTAPVRILNGNNTTVDANGFVKSASPVVKLFKDRIELNDDAKSQPLEFEKIKSGEYLLKGSLGFALEGWFIEVPKDANGNTIVAVVYETLENGDISVKTYKRKFDFDLAAVVADLENPLDIPLGRWIDIRLHEEPEPVLEEIQLSDTPYDFQPTNLSEAIAAAMSGVEPPEVTDEPL